MLKKAGKINDAIIENMLSWHHSDFQVYIDDRIYPSDKTGLGNLARYIVRACFSQESFQCSWLDWLATHIPSRNELKTWTSSKKSSRWLTMRNEYSPHNNAVNTGAFVAHSDRHKCAGYDFSSWSW